MKIKGLIYLSSEIGEAPMQPGSGPETQFFLGFAREALDGETRLQTLPLAFRCLIQRKDGLTLISLGFESISRRNSGKETLELIC